MDLRKEEFIIAIIFVIDDSQLIRSTIDRFLTDERMEVYCASCASEAFQWLGLHTPDCILLDLVLPDGNGYEICTELRQMPSLEDVPILFLTADQKEESIVRGFEAGAADYIAKPFSAAELKARVISHVKNRLMRYELRDAYTKLEKTMDELRNQSLRDPLTGLFNRRCFLENMDEWEVQLPSSPFLMLIDVDLFKQINDQYGHCAGDYALNTIADLVLQTVGENSVVARWGGDEFLIYLAQSTPEEARRIAGDLVCRVAAYNFQYNHISFHGSITIGVTPFVPGTSVDVNAARADAALYSAKDAGRGRFAYQEAPSESI